MSCRRIQAGAAPDGLVTAWRPGATAAIPAASKTDATPVPDPAQIEARVQAAYQNGYAAGEAAGMERAANRIEPAITSFHRIAQELSGLRRRFRAEVEEDTVKLAIAIARRVLHREIATDPEAILGLVIAAFQKLSARETQRLRVSPGDAEMIGEHRARLALPQSLEISADASLAPGSAVFETSRGQMDASVDTQLAEIERGFADIVKRRVA